jgi:hypothetical protein
VSDPSTTFQRLILLAAAFALPGCSVFYELSLDQCKVDADCTSIGQGMICGTDNICKLDDRGCGSNAQCIDENSTESVCVKEQPTSLRGQCVNLKTPECPQLLPLEPQSYASDVLRNSNPVVLGAFTNVTISPFLLNFDLAMTEVHEKNDGLATSGGTRPLLMLACNGNRASDVENFDQSLDTAMDHLLDLKVPGIASGLGATDLKRVFETKGFPANVFFMSAQEADSAFPRQNNGLLWELLPGGTSLARSYRPIIDRTLAFLQGSGALTGTARVAQVNTPDIRAMSDLANGLLDDTTGLFFNGMTAVENVVAGNFLQRTTPSSSQDNTADLSAQVDALLEFKPHVIISLGSREFLTRILPQVEQLWDTRVPDQPRPFYVLSPYQYGDRGALNTMLSSNLAVRTRMLGVNAPAAEDVSVYNDYFARFTRYELPNAGGYENFYDAAYYLLYAAAAARPLSDGLSMATGMGRLLSGMPFEVGPNDMTDAFQLLTTNPASTIQLIGAMGPPNFNTYGGRDDAGAVWCVAANNTVMPDVLKYNDADGTMQGTFPCFPNY